MIILIGGQKGGGGKTTIATNIATMHVIENRDVHLYDIDPQETATLWASLRDQNMNLPVVNSSQGIHVGTAIKNELRALRSKYQDIIIDAGGANNDALRAALLLADLVIFPIIPSGFDMWTFKTLSNLVAGAQGCTKTFEARVLLNKVSTNPARAKREIEDCDNLLSDFDNLTRFNNFLSERVAVRNASNEGMTIVEYKPADSKAIEEIKSIYKEVLSVH